MSAWTIGARIAAVQILVDIGRMSKRLVAVCAAVIKAVIIQM